MRTILLLVMMTLLACGKAAEDAKRREAEKAEAAHREAEKEAARAREEADAAAKKLDDLMKKLEDIDKQTSQAIEGLTNAQNDADRVAATAKLEEARKAKAQLEAELATAKAEAERAQRLRGVKISKECIDNPLAKGCE